MARNRRRNRQDSDEFDPLRGLPQTHANPNTPEGMIEQAGKMADGPGPEPFRWQRVTIWVGAILGLIMLLTTLTSVIRNP